VYARASPIIWQKNVSSTDALGIQLQEKGWYTICMMGPISVGQSGNVGMKVGVSQSRGTRIDYAEVWIDFKLLKNGEAAIFSIWKRE
jgi:hypothetical protein